MFSKITLWGAHDWTSEETETEGVTIDFENYTWKIKTPSPMGNLNKLNGTTLDLFIESEEWDQNSGLCYNQKCYHELMTSERCPRLLKTKKVRMKKVTGLYFVVVPKNNYDEMKEVNQEALEVVGLWNRKVEPLRNYTKLKLVDIDGNFNSVCFRTKWRLVHLNMSNQPEDQDCPYRDYNPFY